MKCEYIGATVRLKVVILHGACKYRKRASKIRFDILWTNGERKKIVTRCISRVVW